MQGKYNLAFRIIFAVGLDHLWRFTVDNHTNQLQILSFVQASKIVGRCPRTLRRWAKNGDLPTIEIGGRPALVYADLLRALGQSSTDKLERLQTSEGGEL